MSTTESTSFVAFTKKPVTIHAVRYIGPDHKLIEEPWDVNAEWLFHSPAPIEPTEHWAGACGEEECQHNYDLYVGTLEDGQEGGAQVRHIAIVTDWIVQGTSGEYYPVKDEIFRHLHEMPG